MQQAPKHAVSGKGAIALAGLLVSWS